VYVTIGGPASGKSSIGKTMFVDDVIDICKINPDDYKTLLFELDHKGSAYIPPNFAALTHDESSYVSDLILHRLSDMMKVNAAPDIWLDVVKPSKNKLDRLSYGGARIIARMASCDADIAVTRAHMRGNNKDGPDYNRFVPTVEILRGHLEATRLIIDTIINYPIELKIYSTAPQQNCVALVRPHNKVLTIHDPAAFCQIIKKEFLNINATNAVELYDNQKLSKNIAGALYKYFSKNISLIFTNQNNNGSSYYACCNVLTKSLEIKDNKTFLSKMNQVDNIEPKILHMEIICHFMSQEINITIRDLDKKLFIASQGRIEYIDRVDLVMHDLKKILDERGFHERQRDSLRI
jgi:hypothetical protein